MDERGTPERPFYAAQEQPDTNNFWMVTVDEGWRSSIVCVGMYRWAADWLVTELQGKPFAPGNPS